MRAAVAQAVLHPSRLTRCTEAFLLSSAALIATSVVIVALYIVKSALGINLMPGPSPLHDLLYPLVRGY